jgi:hypothetical protein
VAPVVRRVRALVVVIALTAGGCADPPSEVRADAPAPSRAAALGFTGVWVAVGTFENPAGPPPYSNTLWPANPPFTARGAAESRRVTESRAQVACQPAGPVFAMWEYGLFPIEILEAPDRLVIKPENIALPRRIYLDGRGHPADLEPTWMGHSVGRWEGDVLVVDTIGMNGRTRPMNGIGSNAQVSVEDAKPRLPASDQLRLVERLRVLADGQILEDDITITDPVMYTTPIRVKHYWQKRPDIDVLEYVCNEAPRAEDER